MLFLIKVETAALLGEWCLVCNEQCVVDHGLKHKTTIHVTEIECELVLQMILASSQAPF